MSTPLEREILTHYYAMPGPFRGGSENWTELVARTIRRFCLAGLLIQQYDSETGLQRVEGNMEALKVYMDALAAVPLPTQQWVVPGSRRLTATKENS